MGQKTAIEIANSLEIYRRKIYRTLKKLSQMEFVTSTTNFPSTFAAVSFDKAFDQFTKANADEADRLEQEKEKILAFWKSKLNQLMDR